MSTVLPTMVIADNGMFLSRGSYKESNNGFASGGTHPNPTHSEIERPFSCTSSSQSSTFKFLPSFTVRADSLSPNQTYKVWLTSYSAEKYGFNSSIQPNYWEDYSVSPSSIAYSDYSYPWRFQSFTTDEDGHVPYIKLTPTRPSGTVNPLSLFTDSHTGSLWKEVLNPIESYAHNGRPWQPSNFDPEYKVQREINSVSRKPFEVTYNNETFEVLALPRRVNYELSLINTSNNQVEKVVTLKVDYILATDLNTQVYNSSPDKLPDGVVNIPVDFNGDGDQYWSPVQLGVDVEKAQLQYSKTTKKDVVMCDSRVNEETSSQLSPREVTVPFQSENVIATTKGGSKIGITSSTMNGDGTMTLTTDRDLNAQYFFGIPYNMEYHLGNMVFKKSSVGGKYSNTNRAIKDNLRTMTVSYSDSASFRVEISHPKREDRIVQFTSNKVGYSNIGESNLETGDFRFHVRGKTRDTNISITDESVFPVKLQHIEIERNMISRSR